MDKYGLQRGVRGSEARHVTTAQYYRDLKRQTGELETGVQQLQEERKDAEKRLKQIKKEIGTQKLEAVKTEAKAALIAKVGSLLGSGEIKELKQENRQLYEEVTSRDESIERLQTMMREQKKQHRKELTEVQAKHIEILNERDKEISRLNRIIEKACKWFPYFMELLRIEKLCHLVGFNQELTNKLVKGEPIVCSGNLYSEEHKRKFITEKAEAQVMKSPTDNTKLVLSINRQPISDWFKERFNKFCSTMQPKQEQKRTKGFRV